MTHPEEHILELFVLNSAKAASAQTEIAAHLRECAGCRSLVEEMTEYYAELDRAWKEVPPAVSAGSVVALAKRPPGLALHGGGLTRGLPPGWSAPVRNLRYYIRRYPIAAAGTTFAFASLAVLGTLIGYREFSRDLEPAVVRIKAEPGSFEVYNRKNELLWLRLLPSVGPLVTEQDRTETPRYIITDLDGDGRAEVVTPIHLPGSPPMELTGLHVIDGRGTWFDIRYERQVNFRGVPYEMPAAIQGGSHIMVDSTDPGNPEILVTLQNDRSPTGVVRMDRKGNVLGEYWHHGQFAATYLRDVNGDGRRELVCCGYNDVDDNVRLSKPVIVVLDPRRITGVTESRLSRGYGFAPSDAELYYCHLPLTEINLREHVNAGVSRMRIFENRLVFLWTSGLGPEGSYDLDFVFTRSFEPLRVVPPTQIHQLFEREYAAGRVSTRLDDAYLEKLCTEVRFWDGASWQPGPVPIAPGSGTAGAGARRPSSAPDPR